VLLRPLGATVLFSSLVASLAAVAAAQNLPPPPPPPAQQNGMITIESDSQRADNKTGIVTATGNVRIDYPDRGMVATSRQAQYFSREGRLVLTGDVDVIDHEGQRIQAEKLVYRVDSERIQAIPPEGEQVRSRIRIPREEPATVPQGGAAVPQEGAAGAATPP
jgi:lipopolysaccharide export system protein LptA